MIVSCGPPADGEDDVVEKSVDGESVGSSARLIIERSWVCIAGGTHSERAARKRTRLMRARDGALSEGASVELDVE